MDEGAALADDSDTPRLTTCEVTFCLKEGQVGILTEEHGLVYVTGLIKMAYGPADLRPILLARNWLLRRTCVSHKTRMQLLNLEQNSDEWIKLRREFVGASEYACMLGLDNKYQNVQHYMLFKRGYFGFEQPFKLEFEVGHAFEDFSGDALEQRGKRQWGIPSFRLDKIGVIVSTSPLTPFLWASIDTLVEGDPDAILPFDLLRKYDRRLCGWEFTEEEHARGGILLKHIIGELKNKVSPKVLLPSDLAQAEDAWIAQIQEQLRICKEQHDLPHLNCRHYALVHKLMPPFKDYRRLEDDMGITVAGGVEWKTHAWFYQYDPEFIRVCKLREAYFARWYFSLGFAYPQSDDFSVYVNEFTYPDWMPVPQLPRGIDMGEFSIEPSDETDQVYNFVKH
jgi:hypothetical protein